MAGESADGRQVITPVPDLDMVDGDHSAQPDRGRSARYGASAGGAQVSDVQVDADCDTFGLRVAPGRERGEPFDEHGGGPAVQVTGGLGIAGNGHDAGRRLGANCSDLDAEPVVERAVRNGVGHAGQFRTVDLGA